MVRGSANGGIFPDFPPCARAADCDTLDPAMERYPTDAQIDAIVVISADEVEMIARSVVSECLHELIAEIAPVEQVRQEAETTETNKEEARIRFPGLSHDIALRPRPTAYVPMRLKKRHQKWRIKICTGNLQLLLPLAA